MTRYAFDVVSYAPLYIHSFRLVQPHTLVEAEKFNLVYTDPTQIDNIADKLRWYRYQHGLLQRDVADYAGLDRSTYSGYENTVKATIEKYVENRHLQDMIHEISIPLETVTEITDNGPKEVERKVFPGYVLVKMVMNDETWHVVRNIRGVTGFLGEGNKPIPLSEDDVASLGVEKREVVVGYQVVDSVKITDGALESFLGTVEELDLERGKVRVVVSMFGRETPVELELDQVEPMEQ